MRSFLTDEQIDKVYKDHMHHFIDVAELVNDLRHYKQLAEQRGKALERILLVKHDGSVADEWNHTTGGSGHAECRKIAKQALGCDTP